MGAGMGSATRVSRWFRDNIIAPYQVEIEDVVESKPAPRTQPRPWADWTEMQPAGAMYGGERDGHPYYTRRWARRVEGGWAVVLMDWWFKPDEKRVVQVVWAMLCANPHDPGESRTWSQVVWEYVENVEASDDGARQAAATYLWGLDWDGTVEQ